MSEPTLFDAEPRPQHIDPIYLQPRTRRPVEVVEPAFLSARISDPETSVEAAKAQTGRTEKAIRELLRAEGPMTSDQCAARLGMNPPTVVSAMSRARKAGWVTASGVGESARKCAATIWRAS